MSNSPEHEKQQTMTCEEVRQQLLASSSTSQQAIAELSDEQLEEVAGGGLSTMLKGIKGTYGYARMYQNANPVRSAWAAIKTGPSAGKEAVQNGYDGTSHGVTNYIYDTQYDTTAKV